MILKVGLVVLLYILLKMVFVLLKESSACINVPRWVQRFSFGIVACVTQLFFI